MDISQGPFPTTSSVLDETQHATTRHDRIPCRTLMNGSWPAASKLPMFQRTSSRWSTRSCGSQRVQRKGRCYCTEVVVGSNALITAFSGTGACMEYLLKNGVYSQRHVDPRRLTRAQMSWER